MSCGTPQPTFCQPLKSTSIAKNIVVTDRRHCIRTIEPPTTQSLVIYNEFGQVVWANGSSDKPICLPELQTLTNPPFILGLTAEGCIGKVAVTYPSVATCEGPTITVPATDVS